MGHTSLVRCNIHPDSLLWRPPSVAECKRALRAAAALSPADVDVHLDHLWAAMQREGSPEMVKASPTR